MGTSHKGKLKQIVIIGLTKKDKEGKQSPKLMVHYVRTRNANKRG